MEALEIADGAVQLDVPGTFDHLDLAVFARLTDPQESELLEEMCIRDS